MAVEGLTIESIVRSHLRHFCLLDEGRAEASLAAGFLFWAGEFGQVGRGGYLDAHVDQGSGAPGCQMFHCARWVPVCGLIITTLVTNAR